MYILTYGVFSPPLLQCDVCVSLNPRAGEILDSTAGIANPVNTGIANKGTHMDIFELANMGIVAPDDYGKGDDGEGSGEQLASVVAYATGLVNEQLAKTQSKTQAKQASDAAFAKVSIVGADGFMIDFKLHCLGKHSHGRAQTEVWAFQLKDDHTH